MTTPFEKANELAKGLAISLRLWELLEEIDKMTPEEREIPENKAMIELVYVLIMSQPTDDIAIG